MVQDELRDVLTNWINQALIPIGRLPAGRDQAAWVAAQVEAWWRERAEDSLADANHAVSALRNELNRLGGWPRFGEALHELAHLRIALADLASLLGCMENRIPSGPSGSGGQ